MIPEKKESKSRAALIGQLGTGSSRLFSYNTQNASIDLFIFIARGTGVGSKTRAIVMQSLFGLA